MPRNMGSVFVCLYRVRERSRPLPTLAVRLPWALAPEALEEAMKAMESRVRWASTVLPPHHVWLPHHPITLFLALKICHYIHSCNASYYPQYLLIHLWYLMFLVIHTLRGNLYILYTIAMIKILWNLFLL